MITFISIGVLIIIFVSIFLRKDFISFKKYISMIIPINLLIAVVYVLIGGFLFVPIADISVPTKMMYSWENKIVAMEDGKAYVVSRHSVDQNDRFYYMVDYGGKYYKVHWVHQYNSKIFEVESDEYVIKTYKETRQAKNWIQRDMVKYLNILDFDKINSDSEYEFYVPKGSVKQEFTIDLK